MTVTVPPAERWTIVVNLIQYPKVRDYLDSLRTMKRRDREEKARSVRREEKVDLFFELVHFIWVEGESREGGWVPQADIRREFAPYKRGKWKWPQVGRVLKAATEIGVLASYEGQYRVRLEKRFNAGTLADAYSYLVKRKFGTEIVRSPKAYENGKERDIEVMVHSADLITYKYATLIRLARDAGIKNPDHAVMDAMGRMKIREAWFLEDEVGPPLQYVVEAEVPQEGNEPDKPFGEDWEKAISDPSNKEAMSHLGLRYYCRMMGDANYKPDSLHENAISGLAEILGRAFSEAHVTVLENMRKDMAYEGKFFEPQLWEDPSFKAFSHLMLESHIGRRHPTTLLELLMISHDLECSIRPNILRMLWAARVSSGESTLFYASSQLNNEDEQGSIRYAMRGMQEWLKSEKADYLDTVERVALQTLFDSFEGDDELQVSFSMIRNWVAHRDFFLNRDGVILGFHPEDSSPRMQASKAQITKFRQTVLGLEALLKGSNVMFLAHFVSRGGDMQAPDVKPKYRMG